MPHEAYGGRAVASGRGRRGRSSSEQVSLAYAAYVFFVVLLLNQEGQTGGRKRAQWEAAGPLAVEHLYRTRVSAAGRIQGIGLRD